MFDHVDTVARALLLQFFDHARCNVMGCFSAAERNWAEGEFAPVLLRACGLYEILLPYKNIIVLVRCARLASSVKFNCQV